ncbi:hypothetical protein J6590_061933 [Homalodisca vitripennis]|nr:hypothetical protein J6590_061933 [Homalodisca vitripennis]
MKTLTENYEDGRLGLKLTLDIRVEQLAVPTNGGLNEKKGAQNQSLGQGVPRSCRSSRLPLNVLNPITIRIIEPNEISSINRSGIFIGEARTLITYPHVIRYIPKMRFPRRVGDNC